MNDAPNSLQASTTSASAATAQSREAVPAPNASAGADDTRAGLGETYEIGLKVTRAVEGSPYERTGDDPLYRPLKVYTLDPSASRLEGAVALVNVPYEPLAIETTGKRTKLVGKVFAVADYDETRNDNYSVVNLDDPMILIRNGREPSSSDWQFHQQMVYAVCSLVYAAFRTALGRHVAWGFEGRPNDQAQLIIRPHAFNGRNAYYLRDDGELCFGYYKAEDEVAGRNLPGGYVFTCLSHDIIAHEVTHALLDGLRTRFIFPSTPDVMAFHEGFADLVAIFQHFSYDQVVQTAIRNSRGDLTGAKLLTDIARQFNYTTSGKEMPLRSAIDITDERQEPTPYCPDEEPHVLGSVLVSAVFEAFTTVFRRKTERYIRLATNGSGVIPLGELSPDLQTVLAKEASKLASQFLTICIRAIDYCPPTDIRFGEYLRAVITADRDLVPDDPWGYREAWIDAFRRRRIYPQDVASLSENALLWKPPEKPIEEIEGLSFAKLKFDGDPARPANKKELERQACALGRVVAKPAMMTAFGLTHQGDSCLGRDTVGLPRVQSIRSSRRVGPDGQVVFDLVAEVTQRRKVLSETGSSFDFYGGSTVIIDPKGAIRYIISKRITNQQRLSSQQEFLLNAGKDFFDESAGAFKPKRQVFKLLHNGQVRE